MKIKKTLRADRWEDSYGACHIPFLPSGSEFLVKTFQNIKMYTVEWDGKTDLEKEDLNAGAKQICREYELKLENHVFTRRNNEQDN